MIGAAIAAGASLIGGNQANKTRLREARKQRQFSLDMWNRQNAYNTPARQMERLKDAGLNPALMYGQGNVGNAEKAMSYQTPQIENTGAIAAQSLASGAQIDLVNSQKKLNEANAFARTIEAYIKGGGSKKTATSMFQNQMDNLQADTNQKKQNIINLDTVNKLNKEYLKLEKAGYHKGNLPATLLKSVFGIDINTQEGQKTAQWLIGGMLGSKVFESLTGGVKNIFQAFKPSATINKTTTIGEMYNNK